QRFGTTDPTRTTQRAPATGPWTRTTPMSHPPPPRPDYGLDAPGVVRNLFLAGAAALLVAAVGWFGPWSGTAAGPALTSMGGCMAVGFLGMGASMVWSSKVGKLRLRERLLDRLPWTGGETVL